MKFVRPRYDAPKYRFGIPSHHMAPATTAPKAVLMIARRRQVPGDLVLGFAGDLDGPLLVLQPRHDLDDLGQEQVSRCQEEVEEDDDHERARQEGLGPAEQRRAQRLTLDLDLDGIRACSARRLLHLLGGPGHLLHRPPKLAELGLHPLNAVGHPRDPLARGTRQAVGRVADGADERHQDDGGAKALAESGPASAAGRAG